ncbi:YbgA family protein, partial [Salinispira pacifica]
FAKMFMERFPDVPVEEEGRLQDPRLRENFIERVFVMQRFRGLLARLGNKAGVGRVGVGTVAGARSAVGVLVAFHTEHKLLLMSHSIAHYRTMGRLVAAAADIPPAELADRYAALLHEAIALLPTVKKHANVLQHIAGYFKRKLSPDERQELSGIIEQYRTGLVPLIVPVTLLNHYVRKYDDSYLKGQVYLNPHPMELKLRLHA